MRAPPVTDLTPKLIRSPIYRGGADGPGTVFPLTAEDLQSALSAGGLASYIWHAKGVGESPWTSVVGGEDLVAAGTPAFEVDMSAELGAGEVGVELTVGTTDRMAHSSNSFGVPGASSWAVLATVDMGEVTQNVQSIFHNGDNLLGGGLNGLAIRCSTAGRIFAVAGDGVGISAPTLTLNHENSTFSVLFWGDRNTARIGVSSGLQTADAGLSLGDITGTANPFMIGSEFGTDASAPIKIAYLAYWSGVAAEGLTDAARASFDTFIGL